jgi:hypothetical protein
MSKVECGNCGHIGYPDFFHSDEKCEECGSREVFEVEDTEKNNKKDNLEVKVPISEFDIELFKDLVCDGIGFTWTFSSQSGEMVDIRFVQEIDKDEEVA